MDSIGVRPEDIGRPVMKASIDSALRSQSMSSYFPACYVLTHDNPGVLKPRGPDLGPCPCPWSSSPSSFSSLSSSSSWDKGSMADLAIDKGLPFHMALILCVYDLLL